MLGLPDTPPVNLGVKFPDANADAVDLLSKMLILDPNRRISVEKALEHPYLSSLHDVALEPLAESHVDWKCIEAVSRHSRYHSCPTSRLSSQPGSRRRSQGRLFGRFYFKFSSWKESSGFGR